jgi:hypothetical protein
MKHIIAANGVRFGIGKKSERVPGLLRKVARVFRSVDTDSNRTNSRLMELIQTLLNAPQLGVA